MKTTAFFALAMLALASAVGVSVDKQTASACNGQQASVSGQVFNTRAEQDAYSLKFSYSQNLFTDYTPALVVPARSIKEFTAYFTPECGTPEGTYDARLVASSSSGDSGSAPFTINVRSCLQAKLSAATVEQTVCPAGKARFELRVKNEGYGNVSAMLSSNATGGSTFSENAFTLKPYEEKRVSMEVGAPDYAGATEKIRITASAFDECTAKTFSQELVLKTRDCAGTAYYPQPEQEYPAAPPSPPEAPSPTPSPGPQQAGEKEVLVDIEDFAFTLQEITVGVGTKITWNNYDGTWHTVTTLSTPADEGFSSGVLAPGKSYSRFLYVPGTYEYYCALHAEMRGRITVVPAELAPPLPTPIPTPTPPATPSPTPSPTPVPQASPTPSPSPTPAPETEVVVIIRNNSFSPQEATVPPNSKVSWRNEGSEAEDVTTISAPADEGFYSGALLQGQGFSRVFYVQGTYEYYSSLNPQARGKIIVTTPAPLPTATTTPAPEANATPAAIVYSVESYAVEQTKTACKKEEVQFTVEYENKGEKDIYRIAAVADEGAEAEVETAVISLEKNGTAYVAVNASANASGNYSIKLFAESAATGIANRATLSLEVIECPAAENMVEVVSAKIAGDVLEVALKNNKANETEFNLSIKSNETLVANETAVIGGGAEKSLEFRLPGGAGEEGLVLLVKVNGKSEEHEIRLAEGAAGETGLITAETSSALWFVVGILVGALALYTVTKTARKEEKWLEEPAGKEQPEDKGKRPEVIESEAA